MADQPQDGGSPTNDPVTRDQLDAAMRTLERYQGEARLAHAELAARVTALVETLAAGDRLALAEYEHRRKRALERLRGSLEERAQLGPDVDKYALEELPQIDCASILPICKARCCTLSVCLSARDLNEGILSWDYQRPYQIRRRQDGYCVYSELGSRRCGVYQSRPAPCRTYDCRRDPRIWVDFEQRILAE
jgi:hypothetical protein